MNSLELKKKFYFVNPYILPHSENSGGKTSSIVSITTTAAGADSGAAADATSTTSDPAEKPR